MSPRIELFAVAPINSSRQVAARPVTRFVPGNSAPENRPELLVAQ
jgi:hypothetical protein